MASKKKDAMNTNIAPPKIDTGAKIVGGRGKTKIRPVTVLSTNDRPERKGVEIHGTKP